MKRRPAMVLKFDGLWQAFLLNQQSKEKCQDVADLNGIGADFDMDELIEISSAVFQQIPA